MSDILSSVLMNLLGGDPAFTPRNRLSSAFYENLEKSNNRIVFKSIRRTRIHARRLSKPFEDAQSNRHPAFFSGLLDRAHRQY
jgi:hypothetical protein